MAVDTFGFNRHQAIANLDKLVPSSSAIGTSLATVFIRS